MLFCGNRFLFVIFFNEIMFVANGDCSRKPMQRAYQFAYRLVGCKILANDG